MTAMARRLDARLIQGDANINQNHSSGQEATPEQEEVKEAEADAQEQRLILETPVI